MNDYASVNTVYSQCKLYRLKVHTCTCITAAVNFCSGRKEGGGWVLLSSLPINATLDIYVCPIPCAIAIYRHTVRVERGCMQYNKL